jgi:hypothetical protein
MESKFDELLLRLQSDILKSEIKIIHLTRSDYALRQAQGFGSGQGLPKGWAIPER